MFRAPYGFVALLFATACATGSTPGSTAGPQVIAPAPVRGVAAVRPLAASAARRHGVPVALVLGVIHVESSFRPSVRSPVGARGLMQLMPRTAASLARRLGYAEDTPIDDPAFNVDAGTSYLAYLLRRFDGDRSYALAAYNSGPSRVAGWRRRGKALPAYSRRYAAAVLAARDRFRAGASVAPAAIEDHDRDGLRVLLRRSFGARPDEPLPVDGASAAAVGGTRATDAAY